jgi:hypothetical protein
MDSQKIIAWFLAITMCTSMAIVGFAMLFL